MGLLDGVTRAAHAVYANSVTKVTAKFGEQKAKDWRVSGIADLQLPVGLRVTGIGFWLYSFKSPSIKVEDAPSGFDGAWPFLFVGAGVVMSLDPTQLKQLALTGRLLREIVTKRVELQKAIQGVFKPKITADVLTGGGEGTAIKCDSPFSPRDLAGSLGRLATAGAALGPLSAGATVITAAPITAANLVSPTFMWNPCWFSSQPAVSLKLRPVFEKKFDMLKMSMVSGAFVVGLWLNVFEFPQDFDPGPRPPSPEEPIPVVLRGRWSVVREDDKNSWYAVFFDDGVCYWTNTPGPGVDEFEIGGVGRWQQEAGAVGVIWNADPLTGKTSPPEKWPRPLQPKGQKAFQVIIAGVGGVPFAKRDLRAVKIDNGISRLLYHPKRR